MKTIRKYFGTDGVRGKVGGTAVNPELVLKLGWAVGKVLANGKRKKVIIGKDTRISGYMLESALEAGLSAAGVDVCLVGPMPTPAIAYLARTLGACVGIVISASHNQFDDNGIKFFSADGFKLPDSVEIAIEQKMDETMETVSSRDLGKASRIPDAPGRYIEFCKSTIPPSVRLNGLKVVLDCANGAAYHIAPSVFHELGAEVVVLADKPNGFNINENCGSTYPEMLQEKVKAHSADIGIALDGDGDRVILADHLGELVDGDEILYVIAKDRLQRGHLKGGVVGTVMSNLGLEQAMETLGVEFVRAQVGDRYVMEALTSRGWKLGAEPSGHIVCLDKISTGDGIIAALQVLHAMQNSGRTLHDLKKGIQKCPQVMLNVPVKNAREVLINPKVKSLLASLEHDLSNQGRILLRPSGTEPLMRIMVEGKNQHMIESCAQSMEKLVIELNAA
jgi:phosphoglucosamine mutase